jgi:5'-3' exoribonuclease 1
MGIPSYFSHIVKNHPEIIRKYIKDILKVDNLYLDCNSIIYDAYNKLDGDILRAEISKTIIQNVIAKIEYYIDTIRPSKTVIIAFDGVAPVAKLEQQRLRRYKSDYQNKIIGSIFNKKDKAWNTTAITPGTKFMYELNEAVSKAFDSKKTIKMELENIIVSGSNKVGEGEHKIYDYIRINPKKHSNETCVIYGLDADLIMLSLNHLPVCPNIYLFRETPHFIQSIDSSLEPECDYFLDIPELSQAIMGYMNNRQVFTENIQRNKMYDYIFLCFFLGNDFLPHFPALNIRTGGIDKILLAYKATIGETSEYITDGNNISWNNLRKVICFLAKLEEKYVIDEDRSRKYKERRGMANTTPEEKMIFFESTPTRERELEKYINPSKAYWHNRYYRGLFGIHTDTNDEQKKDIAINYLQGLEWTMKYYTTGCPDWRWCYKFNYPPLLQDLIKYIPIFNTEFVPNKPQNPVTEIVQLCYVLPRASLNLLPELFRSALLREHSDWYKDDCNFIWAYCKYFWESHVEMNDININDLEGFINANRHLLK